MQTRRTHSRSSGGSGACALCAAFAPLAAQNRAPQGATDIPKVQFEKFTLPNGLDVIVSPDHRLPIVAVNLWYHVGPANEVAGRTGFAHLFEHLMFQGSKHTPHDAHFQMLEAAGATDINGTTDYDRTNYFETVPSQSARAGALDRVRSHGVPARHRSIRKQFAEPAGRRQERAAAERPRTARTAMPRKSSCTCSIRRRIRTMRRSSARTPTSRPRVSTTPRSSSSATTRRTTRASSIVGDVDTAQAKKLVEKYFGTLKRGPPCRRSWSRRRKSPPNGARSSTIASSCRALYMSWLTPAIFKPGDADADIAAHILGGGRASRLYQKLVYEKQIAQDVNVYQHSLMLGSQFGIEVTARPGHTPEELEQAVNTELEALRTQPVEQREIDQARTTIETQTITRLENLNGIANMLNSHNHFLHTPDYLQKDIERYRAVTPATVLAFARRAIAAVLAGRRLRGEGRPGNGTAGADAARADDGGGGNRIGQP